MAWTIMAIGVQFLARLGIFLFATASRWALGPTQPPIQWVPGVKRPGRKSDYSHTYGVEVKNVWIYASTPSIRLHGVAFS